MLPAKGHEPSQLPRARKVKLLFLCTGNSCRSQMAEAWTLHLFSELIEPYSAGTDPKGIDPMAVRVMAEAGVDMKRHTSKSVADLHSVPFDVVVTVCDAANEACPVFPGIAKVVHAGFDDPPAVAARARDREAAFSVYRRVRDEIRAFVEALPTQLKLEKPRPGHR